jgi:uncharacterized membrane protein
MITLTDLGIVFLIIFIVGVLVAFLNSKNN